MALDCLLPYGGTVRTTGPGHPTAAALLVTGDRIAAVLDDPADAPAGADHVDLEGGCALPGFTDAHVHFPSWALARHERPRRRRPHVGRPAWRPEQAIGLDAALASFTHAPSWLEGAEDRRGRLAPGLAADLVVLDRDPHADLAGARVAATMLGGECLLRPPGSA